jgi:hypothetical protein
MKHVYIDSRIRTLALTIRSGATPKNWIFSQGRPWLLITPQRLRRLAAMLGLEDARVDGVVDRVRRECAAPSRYCEPLGLGAAGPDGDGQYPIAICPVCDGVHRPHPLDAALACGECRAGEELRRWNGPTPPMEKDVAMDAAAREVLLANFPDSFVNGELSPNWRFNYERRLERDWDAATNRILMGGTYRRVAREFSCSVGLLHKRVGERKHWESN